VAKLYGIERLHQFVKFCLVGSTGVFVDMALLYVFADPRSLGMNVALSKLLAAEGALVNNFVWNEIWTFKRRTPAIAQGPERRVELLGSGILRRFLIFNAICGVGILLAVLLLHLFHVVASWNLYLSNMLAMVLVTCWNFVMNSRFNWNQEHSFWFQRTSSR